MGTGSTPIQIAREPEFALGAAWVRPALSDVLCSQVNIRLQPRVMQVLVVLAQADGGVVSRAELLARCWGGTLVGEDALNRCIQRLRKLSDELPNCFGIATIARVGYRLERAAPPDLREQPRTSLGGTTGSGERADPLVRHRSRPLQERAIVLAIGAVLTAAGLSASVYQARHARPAPPKLSIFVAPLQAPAGDEPARIFQAGLSNDLARAMVANPLRISVAALGPIASRSLRRLTLDGNAFTVGKTLQAQLRLKDPASEEILWSKSFTGQASAADALREEAALKVGAVLNCAVHTRQSASEPVEAMRLYLSACDDIGDSDAKAALDQLRRLTSLEPRFAEAWAELAATLATSAEALEPAEKADAYRQAATDAQRSLSLDPHTGLAYFALILAHPGVANWPRRISLIERGLRAEPSAAELDNLMGDALLQVGRSSEAVVYYQRAVDLDPLSPVKTADLISALTQVGRYEEAEEAIVKARRVWPEDRRIWSRAFLAEARLGDPDSAERLIDDPSRPAMRDPAEAGYWRARLHYQRHPDDANRNAVLSLIEKKARAPDQGAELVQASRLAELNRIDLAYAAALPAARRLADEDEDFLFLPELATFRADPRFMTLAKRLGLVTIWRTSGRWPDFCGGAHRPYDCAAVALQAPD